MKSSHSHQLFILFLVIELKSFLSFIEVLECYWEFHIELLQSQARTALDLTGSLIWYYKLAFCTSLHVLPLLLFDNTIKNSGGVTVVCPGISSLFCAWINTLSAAEIWVDVYFPHFCLPASLSSDNGQCTWQCAQVNKWSMVWGEQTYPAIIFCYNGLQPSDVKPECSRASCKSGLIAHFESV